MQSARPVSQTMSQSFLALHMAVPPLSLQRVAAVRRTSRATQRSASQPSSTSPLQSTKPSSQSASHTPSTQAPSRCPEGSARRTLRSSRATSRDPFRSRCSDRRRSRRSRRRRSGGILRRRSACCRFRCRRPCRRPRNCLVVGEVGFAARVGVLVAVAEAVVAGDRTAAARARRLTVLVAAHLAAHEAVFDGAEARFAAIGLELVAVGEAVGTFGRRAHSAAAKARGANGSAATARRRIRDQIGFAAVLQGRRRTLRARLAGPGTAHAVDATARLFTRLAARAAARGVGQNILAEAVTARKTRWARFAPSAVGSTGDGVASRARATFEVGRATGTKVTLEVAGEPRAVEIACAADRAAIVRVAVESFGASVELCFAVRNALDAVSRLGIADRRRRELGAIRITPADGRRRGRARARVVGLVRDELVVFDSTGHRHGDEHGGHGGSHPRTQASAGRTLRSRAKHVT